MSTYRVSALTPADILSLSENKTYIDYDKIRPRTTDSGISFHTILIEKDGKTRSLLLTFGPISIINGPRAERNFPNADIQIGTDIEAGKALYSIAKRFEKDYNEGKLNFKGKKPRKLTLPIYEGTEDKKLENPKVKIALIFNKDLSSRFNCVRNVLEDGEIVEKKIECESKTCHTLFRHGTIIAGDILVTYNTHASRGLTLCFEAKTLTVKQAPRTAPSATSNLTDAQKREMLDEVEENDTIEEKLNKLDLIEN